MKHVLAFAALVAVIWFIFFSDASRSAWNGRCGSRGCHPSSTPVTEVRVGEDPAPVAWAGRCNGKACSRMEDPEVTKCLASQADTVFRTYNATHEVGSEFLIKCPDGDAIVRFEIHANGLKGVSLFHPPN